MAEFKSSVTVAAPIEEVFEFLIHTANATKISPPEMGLVFVSAPDVLQVGSRLDFKVQAWGHVQQMVHEITELERPTSFAEKQVKGPFKLWYHWHQLMSTDMGHTVVTDRIEFEPPGGLIGLLVTKTKILDHLEEGFEHRHERLRKLLEK